MSFAFAARALGRMLPASLALLCLTITPTASATNFMVGDTASGCTYSTIGAAIAAAASVVSGSKTIYIARNATYTHQGLVIDGQRLTLVGGIPDCNHLTSAGNTLVDGGAGTSVLTIRGDSHVTLRNLTIEDGNDGDGDAGGGIDFAGTGVLSIDHATIFGNHAGYGGGININGSGGAAQLVLGTEVSVSSNTATTSGGGIRIEGNAQLTVLAPQVLISYNEAVAGYGGGIEVIGPARADLGSPGYRFGEYVGLLYRNSAQYGGGLSLNSGSGDSQPAVARLFTTDANNPVLIEENSAAHTGGGVYLQTDANNTATPGRAKLCGIDYRLSGNIAQEGSAIYADEDYAVTWGYVGSDAVFNRSIVESGCGGATASSLGAVTCTSEACNRIDNNLAQDSAGHVTAGSTILLQTNSALFADPLHLVDNHAAHVLRLAGGGDVSEQVGASVFNTLLAGNVVSSDLVLADASTRLALWNCTIANNSIAAGAVVHTGGKLTFTDSIVAQGSTTTVSLSGSASDLLIDYLMSLEIASLAQGTHVMQADPAFVDAGNDFRLRPTSLAIDVAPAFSGDDRDLDNKPHDQDMPAVANHDGPRDLGAYERQLRYCGAADTIFCSTFDFD